MERLREILSNGTREHSKCIERASVLRQAAFFSLEGRQLTLFKLKDLVVTLSFTIPA